MEKSCSKPNCDCMQRHADKHGLDVECLKSYECFGGPRLIDPITHLIVTEEGLKIYKDDPSSAILCEDQERAKEIIKSKFGHDLDQMTIETKGYVYPVPGIEFEPVEKKCEASVCDFRDRCSWEYLGDAKTGKKLTKCITETVARLVEHTAEKESPEIDKVCPIGIRKIEEYQSQFDESDAQYRAIENLIQWLIDESKKAEPVNLKP